MAVSLLSTMHKMVQYFINKMPLIVVDYNSTKHGVDKIDETAKHFTCKISGRRWPVQLFCNLHALAIINACTLFREVTGSHISR